MDETLLMHELRHFLDGDGRLKGYPAKRRPKLLSLYYLAGKFEPGRRYTEKEVNEVLKRWHTFGDWCMLRRDLYDLKFLGREDNGASYWLENPQPELSDGEPLGTARP